MRTTHNIKIRVEFADAVLSREKCFEVRRNDRGYQKGDLIRFCVIHENGMPITHELCDKTFEVTYVLSDWGEGAIANGYVVLGILQLSEVKEAEA